ncbi:hypothetical protein [Thalassococcus lentus]|uniref:Lipoprotein n=1 Tax=Thalassococcus lentus TaxID=1210524 RepID=A0ABT4XQW7_9RHOB|nr:hypothetical protein [Thalassococcus lentus]MDA7424339.1 hypothetical protein [Thalassococcus lentus]
MVRPFIILVLSASILASCATVRDSRLNPMNWFGRSVSEPVATDNTELNPLIPRGRRTLFSAEQPSAYQGRNIGEVNELLVERRPGGAIVRATGTADRQGPFDVRLVKVDDQSDATTLTYAFKALQQRGPQGREQSRTVTVAIWLTDNDLNGINTIRVLGDRNVRSVRR